MDGPNPVETISVRYTGTPPNTPNIPVKSPKDSPKSPKKTTKAKMVKQRHVVATPSLEVPDANARIRSSSFDTSSLGHGDEDDEDNTLQVPTASRRSRSFDANYAGASTSDEGASSDREASSSFLGIPKYYRRRSTEIPKLCIHCVHLEALSEMGSSQETSPTSLSGSAFELDKYPDKGEKDYWSSESETEDDSDDESFGSGEKFIPITLSVTPTDSDEAIVISSTVVGEKTSMSHSAAAMGAGTSLQVPHVKPRSASMDASYLQPGTMDDRRASLDVDMLDTPKQPRSSSVEVSLPTEESSCYRAITSPSTASER